MNQAICDEIGDRSLPQKHGGEGGIRTHEAFAQRFSSVTDRDIERDGSLPLTSAHAGTDGGRGTDRDDLATEAVTPIDRLCCGMVSGSGLHLLTCPRWRRPKRK